MEKNSKIYIAGNTGLVGSAIVRKLKLEDYTNLVFTPFPEYDLRKQLQVEDFFKREKPEYVFLAAAKVGGILANSTFPAEFIYDNLMIATNVIHSSYKYRAQKLLNLGSSCIYPKFTTQPLKEEYLLTGLLEPTNEPYAIAKITAIKMCRYYNQQYKTNFISVMPTNLYGPGDNFNLDTSHVLPAMIRKMHLANCLENNDIDSIRKDLNKLPIENIDGKSSPEDILKILSKYGIKISHRVTPSSTEINYINKDSVNSVSSVVSLSLWGTGSPRREFLYVDDLADAIIFLMNNYDAKDIGEFVNIGTGKDITIKEIAEIIKKIVGFKGRIEWDTSKPDGTPRKLLDVSKINNIGWHYSIDVIDGIKATFKHYKGN